MKNPPWLAAAGWFSARDNAQTFLGSQLKSAGLFVLQVIEHFGAVDEFGCGFDGAEDSECILVGDALLENVAEGDDDRVVGDDCPFGLSEHFSLTDQAGKSVELDFRHT